MTFCCGANITAMASVYNHFAATNGIRALLAKNVIIGIILIYIMVFRSSLANA